MSKKPSFRDLTQLSAYLDGELSASAQKRIKDRLARDPEFATALDDLRLSRTVLRRTPQRRAPRNFTLSPQMVAKRPPMPRLVPALNYASLAMVLLFVFSFLAPVGTGGVANQELAAAPMAMEMEEMPAPALAEEAPEMAAEPAADSAMEEEAAPAEEEAGLAERTTPLPTAEGVQAEKTDANAAVPASAMPEPEPQLLLTGYQRALVIFLGVSVFLSWALRRATIAKWRKKLS